MKALVKIFRPTSFGCLIILLLPALMISQPEKRVLIEVSTSTTCEWCPNGIESIKALQALDDNIIVVAVHHGDPMENQLYETEANFSTFPSAHIERTLKNVSPGSWPGSVIGRLNNVPPAEINVSTNYNTANRSISITVGSSFYSLISGDYRLAAIIVEDAVTGPSPGYDQSNAYSGGDKGKLAHWEYLSNPAPANKMVYNHVGRYLVGGYLGELGSLPGAIGPFNSHNHIYTYNLPPEYDDEYIYVVGLLINASNGQVLNAAKSDYILGYSNAKPKFVSKPINTGFANIPYTYSIFATDPDDDSLHITGTFPAWLSMVDQGDGNARLSGTPPFPGKFNINLSVNDDEWTRNQTFTIDIAPQPVEDWFYVGNPGFSPTLAKGLDLDFDNQGNPYCLYENASADQLLLMKYNQGNWQQNGLAISGEPGSYGLGIGPNDTPYVFITKGGFRILKQVGAYWEQVGDIISSNQIAYPDFKISSSGTLYITYLDLENGNRGIVKKWANGIWETVGGDYFSQSTTVWHQLILDKNDQPVILFGQGSGTNFQSAVKIFDGNNWQNLGSQFIDSTLFTQVEHQLAISPNNEYYVALLTNMNQVQVYKLENNNWENIGTNISGDEAAFLNLVIDENGKVIVGFQDKSLGDRSSVMTLNDNEWEYLGLAGFTNQAASQKLVIGFKENPYLAYIDLENHSRLSTKRFTNPVGLFSSPLPDYQLEVYPNPNQGNFLLKSQNADNYQILDVRGRIILQNKIITPDQVINLKNKSAGIYLLKVIGKQGIQTKKIMISR